MIRTSVVVVGVATVLLAISLLPPAEASGRRSDRQPSKHHGERKKSKSRREIEEMNESFGNLMSDAAEEPAASPESNRERRRRRKDSKTSGQANQEEEDRRRSTNSREKRHSRPSETPTDSRGAGRSRSKARRPSQHDRSHFGFYADDRYATLRGKSALDSSGLEVAVEDGIELQSPWNQPGTNLFSNSHSGLEYNDGPRAHEGLQHVPDPEKRRRRSRSKHSAERKMNKYGDKHVYECKKYFKSVLRDDWKQSGGDNGILLHFVWDKDDDSLSLESENLPVTPTRRRVQYDLDFRNAPFKGRSETSQLETNYFTPTEETELGTLTVYYNDSKRQYLKLEIFEFTTGVYQMNVVFVGPKNTTDQFTFEKVLDQRRARSYNRYRKSRSRSRSRSERHRSGESKEHRRRSDSRTPTGRTAPIVPALYYDPNTGSTFLAPATVGNDLGGQLGAGQTYVSTPQPNPGYSYGVPSPFMHSTQPAPYNLPYPNHPPTVYQQDRYAFEDFRRSPVTSDGESSTSRRFPHGRPSDHSAQNLGVPPFYDHGPGPQIPMATPSTHNQSFGRRDELFLPSGQPSSFLQNSSAAGRRPSNNELFLPTPNVQPPQTPFFPLPGHRRTASTQTGGLYSGGGLPTRPEYVDPPYRPYRAPPTELPDNGSMHDMHGTAVELPANNPQRPRFSNTPTLEPKSLGLGLGRMTPQAPSNNSFIGHEGLRPRSSTPRHSGTPQGFPRPRSENTQRHTTQNPSRMPTPSPLGRVFSFASTDSSNRSLPPRGDQRLQRE